MTTKEEKLKEKEALICHLKDIIKNEDKDVSCMCYTGKEKIDLSVDELIAKLQSMRAKGFNKITFGASVDVSMITENVTHKVSTHIKVSKEKSVDDIKETLAYLLKEPSDLMQGN